MPTTTIRFASAVPQFTVPDVVQTAEYYRDVLGFTIAGYWDGERVHDDAGAPAVFGIVRRDEVRLHFSRAEHAQVRAERDPERVSTALAHLRDLSSRPGSTEANVMPALIECANAYVTLGEMCGVFRTVFGEYREPVAV